PHRRIPPAPDPDRRTESLRAGGDRRSSPRQSRPPRSPHPLRRPDRRGAAGVRLLHQRRDVIPLLVRALSGQQAAGIVRAGGDADQDSGEAPCKVTAPCQLPTTQRPTPNQHPTPNSQLATPNSQLPTSNFQLPTSNFQLPTPKDQRPKTRDQRPETGARECA